jgi:hypothetical protein
MYCIVDSGATYIMVVKFRNTIWPPPPQLSLTIGELRCQASQTEHGPYIVPKRSLYCEISKYRGGRFLTKI